MATRSSGRRSAGSDGAEALKPSMIHLAPLGRLKEECIRLGLPVNGSKTALADRLQEYHDLGGVLPTETLYKTEEPAMGSPVKKKRRSSPSLNKSVEKKPKGSKKKQAETATVESLEVEPEEVGFSIRYADDANKDVESDDDNVPLIQLGNKATEKQSPRKRPRQEIQEDSAMRDTGELLDKGDSEWVPEGMEKGPRSSQSEKRLSPKKIAKWEVDSPPPLKKTASTEEFDKTKQLIFGSELKKVKKESSETSSESSDVEKEWRRREEKERRRKEENVRKGEKEKDSPEGNIREVRAADIKKESERRKEKPITAVWVEYLQEKEATKQGVKSGVEKTTAEADTSLEREEQPKTTDERKKSAFGPRVPPPSQSRPMPPIQQEVDLLGNIIGKQHELLQKRLQTNEEAEMEKIRIQAQLRHGTIERQEEHSREERIRLEKQREKDKREREKERERKERESRSSSFSLAPPPPTLKPRLPIPGPPPGPKPQQKKEEVTENATIGKAVEDSPPTPEYEPLEEEGKTNTGENSVKGEVAAASEQSTVSDHTATKAGERVEEAEENEEEGERCTGHLLPRTPGADSQVVSQFNHALLRVLQQRQLKDQIEVKSVMNDLLLRVEEKLEKEKQWAMAASRRGAAASAVHNGDSSAAPSSSSPLSLPLLTNDNAGSNIPNDKTGDPASLSSMFVKDPRELLARASELLKAFDGRESERPGVACAASESSPTPTRVYEQLRVEPGSYAEEKEERPLPEFHGEPVPSDDDDGLFEQAAGIKKEKKPKHPVVEEEAPPSHENLLLDYYNACLHVKSATEKEWLVEPEAADGLALMWGGVRTNYGIPLPFKFKTGESRNVLVFQVKIVEHLPTRHIPFNEAEPHDVRVGFSLRSSPNILGEFPNSFCFCATGRKAVNNIFSEFGDPCDLNDVITAAFDLSKRSIWFWKNSTLLGEAFSGVELPEGDALFPHIAVKNCKVAVNLGDFPAVSSAVITACHDDIPDWPERMPEWLFPRDLERGDLEMSRLPPSEKTNCTMLMMVGLPGVGKTTWVRQYLRDHPGETWNVINAETVTAAMKVNGVPRARAHSGRWDMVMGVMAKALSRLVLLAARRRRNYIIDMSNVARETRKRRLMHFKDFQKKCILIIPDEDEMVARQQRQARQEGVNLAPPEAMLEMKAVFSIPNEETEGIEEVFFIEPPIERVGEAIDRVERFNAEGRPWFQKRYRGRGGRRGGGPLRALTRRDSGDSHRFSSPLCISTSGLNGSGPPSGRFGDRKSMDSPSYRSAGGPSPMWAQRRSTNS